MEKQDLERAGAIALNRIFGYEPAISTAITDALGNSFEVFGLSQDGLCKIFGPYSKYSGKVTPVALDDALRELEWLKKEGYSFISRLEPGYPSRLRDCPDAPAGLYVRSGTPAEEIFTQEPHIAIVGTRDPSPYGIEWCNRLVAALALSERPPVIVSGLALGIDICAHLSALGHDLKTLAVLPTSIDEVYPRRHSVAAGKIAARPGCALVSDFPRGTGPQAFTFLRRNRIIAALSDATILVESRLRGGGTITTRYAADYGRGVYALPGRIDDIRSEGCNRIISEKIAEPISSLDNLIRDLGIGNLSGRGRAGFEEFLAKKYADDARIRTIGMAIKTKRGVNIDELCRITGMPYPVVSAECGRLQNDNVIEIDLLQRCTVKIS